MEEEKKDTKVKNNFSYNLRNNWSFSIYKWNK